MNNLIKGDYMKIFKIINFLYFYLPLIISVILLLQCGISFYREKDFNPNNLRAGVVGILSIIIISLAIKVLPNTSLICTIGICVVKFICIPAILFAIGDTCEGNKNGIKGIIYLAIAIIIFGIMGRLFL